MRKSKTPIKRTPRKAFSLTLRLGDKTFTSKGATMLDALVALPRPPKIVTKGILTVKNGVLTKEELYYPVRLKRLFYNKYFQIIHAKQLAVGLKPR